MKKLKLTLNKETIAKLEDEKMDAVKGGETYPCTNGKCTQTYIPSCKTCYCISVNVCNETVNCTVGCVTDKCVG